MIPELVITISGIRIHSYAAPLPISCLSDVGNISSEATDWFSVTFSNEAIRPGVLIVADHGSFLRCQSDPQARR